MRIHLRGAREKRAGIGRLRRICIPLQARKYGCGVTNQDGLRIH